MNVIIPIDDKYCNVIDNYVEYISGNKIAITYRDYLLNIIFLVQNYFILTNHYNINITYL